MNRKTYIYIYKVMAVFVTVIIMTCLSACSDDDEFVSQNIRFTRPVLTGITRAHVTGCEQNNPYDKEETFRVFGYRYYKDTQPKDVFAQEKEFGPDGAEAIYNKVSDTWNTTVEHLWQYNYLYAFRAYSPASIEGAVYDDTDTGLKIHNYTLPGMGKQYDLLYAPAVYDKEKYTSTQMTEVGRYNEVSLIFKHALSTIHFRVRTDPRYIKEFPLEERAEVASRYTIRSIKISGVYDKASFNEMSYAVRSENGEIVNIPIEDTQQMWTDHGFSSTEKNTYEFIDESKPINGVSYKGEPQDITEMSEGARMGFMIPQQIPEDAEIRVEWTHRTLQGTRNYVSVFLLKDIGDSVKKMWKPGRRYIYTLAVWDFRMDLEPAAESIIDDSDIEI